MLDVLLLTLLGALALMAWSMALRAPFKWRRTVLESTGSQNACCASCIKMALVSTSCWVSVSFMAYGIKVGRHQLIANALLSSPGCAGWHASGPNSIASQNLKSRTARTSQPITTDHTPVAAAPPQAMPQFGHCVHAAYSSSRVAPYTPASIHRLAISQWRAHQIMAQQTKPIARTVPNQPRQHPTQQRP